MWYFIIVLQMADTLKKLKNYIRTKVSLDQGSPNLLDLAGCTGRKRVRRRLEEK